VAHFEIPATDAALLLRDEGRTLFFSGACGACSGSREIPVLEPVEIPRARLTICQIGDVE